MEFSLAEIALSDPDILLDGSISSVRVALGPPRQGDIGSRAISESADSKYYESEYLDSYCTRTAGREACSNPALSILIFIALACSLFVNVWSVTSVLVISADHVLQRFVAVVAVYLATTATNRRHPPPLARNGAYRRNGA